VTEVLYRLAEFCVRFRRYVIAGWVAALVGIGVLAATVAGTESNAFAIPGTESQRAIDLLDQRFPGSGGALARVVVAAPPGKVLSDPQYAGLATAALAKISASPQVIAVTPLAQAVVSKDKRIAFLDVHYSVPVDKVSKAAKDTLEAAVAPARKAGLDIEFSGGVIATTQSEGNNDLYGVLIAFVVLTVTFGALVAAGLPLITALIGVGIGLLGVKAISGAIEINSTAPTLALMLGLAVGIDYTLFILSRHRQQLRAGMAVQQSVAMATATAGGAVVFAGITVVIALAGLAVVGIPFLTVMGLAAAATVAIVVVLAITFVPAVLSVLGPRIDRGSIGVLARRQERLATRSSFGERWSRIPTARPWITVAVTVIGIGVISLPVLDLKLGLPDDSSKPTSSTQRRAYDLLTEGFGAGFTGPLTLVVYTPGQAMAAQDAATGAERLKTFPDVAAVSAPTPNQAGDVAIIQVTPGSSPASAQTKKLVSSIRDAAAQVRKQYNVEALVTGTTASNIDVSSKLGSALPLFLVLIVGLAFLLLMLVFRSILVPLKAIIGFLLSIGASLGIVVLVFQEGHLGSLLKVETPGPIVSFLPILLVGILFGLAMDYEVFLVSRIREHYVEERDVDGSIRSGMRDSARVVTAAGLIMTSVFGSFIFGDDVVIKSIGLALAFGVLIDAFVVRMTLVPAILKLLGHRAWALPGWLDRHLPNLDLEGSLLTTRTETSQPEASPAR
jgi:RND superfamily putative drug exporter